MKKIFLSLIALAALSTGAIAQGPSYPHLISRGVPSSYSVSNVSGTALAANNLRRGAVITNTGATNIAYLSLNGGAAAVAGQGIALLPNGGTLTLDLTELYRGTITAITASSTTTLSITEYQ